MFIRCRQTPGMPDLFDLSLHDDHRAVLHRETFLSPNKAQFQMALYLATINGWRVVDQGAEPTVNQDAE